MKTSIDIGYNKIRNASYLKGVNLHKIYCMNVHLPEQTITVFTKPGDCLSHTFALYRALTVEAILEIENIEAFDKQGNPL